MEIPSIFYMQALSQRIEELTDVIRDMPEYKQLKDFGCAFFDAYILYDPVTESQLEFDRYFIKSRAVHDWQRMTAIINCYTTLVAQICIGSKRNHYLEKFKQIQPIREAFYKQLIREYAYNNLKLYWHNMNGNWMIRYNKFEPPWAYYDVYKVDTDTPCEMGRMKLDKVRLYLTRSDMERGVYSLMQCEELFQQLRRETGYFG